MTDIVNIPEGILSSDFPTNADRTAGVFNQKSYDWAVSARAMSARDREIAVAGRTNALAATEKAQAAAGSATAADGHANRATSAADAAMGYRDTAGQHAGTAATHAGTAATKAGEAAASAQLAGEHKQQALQAVADAQGQVTLASEQAVRAETAAASIAAGPITSLQVHSGLKTGAVTLGLEDLADKATDQQMQQGAEADPLLMSPAGVKAAVLAHAPKTLVREARAANAQLVKADNGKLIDITSGTFTQTFAPAATLGDGWFCYLKNSGSGDISISTDDPKLDATFPRNWNGNGAWVFGESFATLTNYNISLTNTTALAIGRSYKITFTVSNKSGAGGIYVRTNNGFVSTPLITTNGSYELNVASATATGLQIVCSGTLTATISDLVIEDKSPFVMYPGEVRLVQCDGVALRTVVLNSFYKVFTASGNFIKPPGYAAFGGIAWDGGQSGGMSSVGTPRTGGLGSKSKCFFLTKEDIGISASVVVGSGGSSVAGNGTFEGNPGGKTAIDGFSGFISTWDGVNPYKAGDGGNSNYGGASALPGEISPYAGDGGKGAYGPASGSMPGGEPGTAPGGGGGASSNNGGLTPSGAGARGELRIWGII